GTTDGTAQGTDSGGLITAGTIATTQAHDILIGGAVGYYSGGSPGNVLGAGGNGTANNCAPSSFSTYLQPSSSQVETHDDDANNTSTITGLLYCDVSATASHSFSATFNPATTEGAAVMVAFPVAPTPTATSTGTPTQTATPTNTPTRTATPTITPTA